MLARIKSLLLPLVLAPAVCADAQSAVKPPSQWLFWKSYASHFITPEGRVADPDRGQMTTSEGQGYAMFFATVANDRVMFERLRNWTEMNLAKGDLGTHLPSWSWGQAGGEWALLDENSASDADLWLAYDLIQAGALWGDADYSRQGLALLRQVARVDVVTIPQLGPVLMPGHDGFHPTPESWVLNPSYMPPQLINAAAHADPGGPWKQMAARLPALLEHAASHGFAMDWVTYASGQGFVPSGGPGNDPKPPEGSYDAIRLYLWLGIGSADNPARPGMIAAFAPMVQYLRAHPLPPEVANPDGSAQGTGPLGFSAALTPFLWASHEKFLAAEQQRRTQAGFDPQTGLLGSPARYYDQNLALFATAWQENRFRFTSDGMLRVSWKN